MPLLKKNTVTIALLAALLPLSAPTAMAEGHQIEAAALLCVNALKSKNYEHMKVFCRAAADMGVVEAQYMLGYHYKHGLGFDKDLRESVKWFRLAAEQGLVGAQFSLAAAYTSGDGVERDEVEALKWFHRAAETGDPRAQMMLGVSYRDGVGTPEDPAEAAKWFLLAAEQGLLPAQLTISKMYFDGYGVEKDVDEAKRWIALAEEMHGDEIKEWLTPSDAGSEKAGGDGSSGGVVLDKK